MITVTVDTKAFQASLDDIGKNQLPYATSVALNNLALETQTAVRAHLGETFHLRRTSWANLNIKITHFAKKYDGDLYAEMGVHAPGGDQRSDILGKFEDQTQKTPFSGSHIAVPIGPNAGKVLPSGQRLRDYHLRQVGNRWEGDADTFMIRLKNGNLLVLQRRAKRTSYKRHGKRVSVKAGDTVPLFYLVPKVKITPDLQFEQIARDTAAKRWGELFAGAFNKAMETAR